ncbi:MAG: DNA polymerase Y family protein [Candidatus Comchoanobacterales bacterium]
MLQKYPVLIHMDLDAFFASIEQRDEPTLMGQPVAITNGKHGRMLITCSYEARAYGLFTTMPVWEAQKRCPNLILLPSRLHYYAAISQKLMQYIYDNISPEIDLFSVDEAFIKLPDSCYDQQLMKSIYSIHQQINLAFHLPISMGVGHNKTNAKYATQLNKPMGISIIKPHEAEKMLAHLPVDEICGIGKGLKRMFAQKGVYRCGQVKNIPISELSKRFGTPGRLLWHQCQGNDQTPFVSQKSPQKSASSSKVMPPNTHQQHDALFFLAFIAHELAAKLATLLVRAGQLKMTIVTSTSVYQQSFTPTVPVQNALVFLGYLKTLYLHYCQNQSLKFISIEAHRLIHEQQTTFFHQYSRQQLQKVMNHINEQFGKQTIHLARLIPSKSHVDTAQDLKRR